MEIISEGELKSSNGKDYIFYKTLRLPGQLTPSPIHLFFTHDFLQHQVQWMPFIEQLPIACKVTLWDLPGHGVSGGERNHCDDYHSWVVDLDKLIKQQAVENEILILIGQGLGASINLAYLLDHDKGPVGGGHFFKSSPCSAMGRGDV